jgi:septal ring-binding cell division protein DamX
MGSAIFNLSACTLFDDPSVGTARQGYLGWYCETDIDVSDQWRCSERLMSDALPIDKVSQRLKKVPMPTAKNQAEEKSLLGKTLKERVEQKTEQYFYTDFDISADGYTVQLGAYLSQAMAEQSAAKIISEGGLLVVRNIIADGQYRFVIVYGQYSTHQQAKAVAEHLTTLNPQLDYWVRSIKSLRKRL